MKAVITIGRIYYPKNVCDFTVGNFAIFSATIKDLIYKEADDGDIDVGDVVKICGKVPSLSQKKRFIITAHIELNDKYGDRFRIDNITTGERLKDKEKQDNYLKYVLGEKRGTEIIYSLPNAYDDIMNKDIEALCSVKGIGKSTAEKIIKKALLYADDAKVLSLLYDYSVTLDMATKLIKRYESGDTLYNKIKDDPYILAREVRGIGWKKVDRMAHLAGVSDTDPNRIKSFVKLYLDNQAEDGMSWFYLNEILSVCKTELSLTNNDEDAIHNALDAMVKEGTLIKNDKQVVYLKSVFDLEKNIADELRRIQKAKPVKVPKDFDKKCSMLQRKLGIQYTDEQLEAIKTVCSNSVSVLTGYGGTGKTTVVAAVIELLKDEVSFKQTALSGRAAARMSEITGDDGYTIHRLLGYAKDDNGNFVYKFTKTHQMPYNGIIIDELSMVGADLFYDLISAIQSGSHLIMIGDDGQLESIGKCNILKDLLNCGEIPVAKLTKIHRQAAKSAIITDSIKVRNGMHIAPIGWFGEETKGELQDLKLDIFEEQSGTFDHIIYQYKKILKDHLSTKDNIQVVVPQRVRGSISTSNLNNAIQEIVNPLNVDCVEIEKRTDSGYMKYKLKVGDNVIVTTNNYETEKLNGEVCPTYNGNKGIIVYISNEKFRKDDYILIDFDQWGKVKIPRYYHGRSNWETIELAYALTCHKLQGSEARNVIVGFDFSAMTLLSREWLYTAITRAKKYCVVCAQASAMNYATRNSPVMKKRTFLIPILKGRL